MNIREALWILDRVHTRDDDNPAIRYTVEQDPFMLEVYGQHRYVEAWGVVRDYLRGVDVDAANLKENERLRAWIRAIGNLPDVDADNRSWMAAAALKGQPVPGE